MFTHELEGTGHFGLWPLSEAANACFGPTDCPAPGAAQPTRRHAPLVPSQNGLRLGGSPAESWIEWTRRPNFDAYWAYRHTFLEEVLPPPGRATLEIGCGEGRVARDMTSRGHSVTAIDASPALVASAAAMDSVSVYRVADAECLPFADSSFDAVVTYNSLMDVEDMPAVVREASRVLTKDGSLAVCITHPLCDAGTFPDYSSGSPFVIEGSYRGKRPFAAVVERDGLVMDFGGGYAYDLESYRGHSRMLVSSSSVSASRLRTWGLE